MLSSELKPGQRYLLPVNRQKCTKDYFVVYTENHEFKVYKLKFQRQEASVPDELQCIVKGIKNDVPVVGQDLAPIIARFYRKNEEYAFTVKADYTAKNGFYEIEDDRGLYFRLYDKSRLFLGQSIKCKITGIKDVLVYLKLSSGKARVNFLTRFISLEDLLKRLHRKDAVARYVIQFLLRRPEMAAARQEHKDGSPSWIFTALQCINENIAAYLVDSERYERYVIPLLELNKDISLYLLEGSDFLKQFDDRAGLQKMLSDNIQYVKHYLKVLELIIEGKDEMCLNEMLENLQRSGYIYHPNKQFHIMMTIFKIKPNLVTKYMGKIFNALRDWGVSNWRNEPFRSAFVEQLEMFINATRRQVDEMQSIESEEDSQIFGQMVKAIAIQTIIANDEDDIDINRNRSMLYRYLTFTDPAGRETLLYKSLYCIIENGKFPTEFNWDDTQQEIVIKTKSMASKDGLVIDSNTVKTYSGDRCKVTMSDAGIMLQPTNILNADVPALPNGIIEWPLINVCLPNGIATPNASKRKNLLALRNMWSEIERNLFAEIERKNPTKKILPDVGDTVKINIDRIDSADGKVRLHCVVNDDSHYGEGWLNIKDVVKYTVDPDVNDFYENGQPRLFEAKVLGRSKDDELTFTMKDFVNALIMSEVDAGFETVCVVTDEHPECFSAISSYGFSLWINKSDATAGVKVKDFVSVTITESQSVDKIKGNVNDNVVWPSDCFVEGEPFETLVDALTMRMDDVSEEEFMLEENISRDQIFEIIQLLRRLAVINTDYIRSYNLLAMARLIALTIDDVESAAMLETHMQLLLLLKTYSDTNRLKADELKNFEDAEVLKSPIINRLYTKLDILTRLGDDTAESKSYLWKKVTKPNNELEGRLANMVMAHNMLDVNMFAEQRDVISLQIRKLLNVSAESTSAKFYGSETQTVEFKTSIVFPPGNHMQPDLKSQTMEIMLEICGMLNSKGGTLYLGVNDSGYASGLEQDLRHGFENSPDKLGLYVDNQIDTYLGKTARQCIEMDFDKESQGRTVLIFKIAPCKYVIEVCGKVYVRQGTSVREFTGKDLEAFRKDRQNEFEYQKEVEKSNRANKSLLVASELIADEKTVAAKSQDTVAAPTVNAGSIITSKVRNNALHDYENDYTNVDAYIYFVDGCEYMVSRTDRYLEQEQYCRLALAVRGDECNGCMVMVYEDLYAVRVPMVNILGKNEGQKYPHCKDKTVKWIAPSSAKGDCLLVIATDSKGKLYYRVDAVDNLVSGNMESFGARIIKVPVGEIVHCEIVPAGIVGDFEKGLKASESQIGYPLNVRKGTPQGVDAVRELLSKIKYDNHDE